MKEPAISENHLYSKVYRKGKKSEKKTVVVYTLPDRHASLLAKCHPLKIKVNRLGLTVSKKIGGAVERNRVKRIIRQGYRDCIGKAEIRPGNLIVIVARSSALDAKSTEVASDLYSALCELGLIK